MSKIGITLGDPSGIGPEIVARSLVESEIDRNKVVVIGNKEHFLTVALKLGIDETAFSGVKYADIPAGKIPVGKISEVSGRVAVESIEEAVNLAEKKEISGICTAPINKEAILLAGSKYKDHTDMLGALTGSRNVVTMFEVEDLRIIFLSKHVSLKEACGLVTKERVMENISLADRSLRSLGIEPRRIAVAALNPHGGENGLFGTEEIKEIRPAIKELSKEYDVSGPIPADSVFYQAAGGRYDVVIALYHDQGHIAAKTLNFTKTVSMNLGLPFLRTSVDHGTAFDIAGKGIADHTSMLEAIQKCFKYSDVYSARADVFNK